MSLPTLSDIAVPDSADVVTIFQKAAQRLSSGKMSFSHSFKHYLPIWQIDQIFNTLNQKYTGDKYTMSYSTSCKGCTRDDGGCNCDMSTAMDIIVNIHSNNK